MIGKKINYYRKQVNLPLREIAERTGLSIGYLSNVERGNTSPTYENLCKICDAMSINLVDLILNTSSYRIFVKKSERTRIYSADYRTIYEFTTDQNLNMQGMALTFPEDYFGTEVSWGHDTDEWGVVVKGALAFEVNGTTYIMEEGDSIYVKAGTPHKFRKVSQEECVSYWTRMNYFRVPSAKISKDQKKRTHGRETAPEKPDT